MRRAWVISALEVIAFLKPAGAWAGLRAIGLVEAERRVGGKREVEPRHYLLSAPLDAATFGRAGHAAQSLATLRHVALNPLRQDRPRRGSLATKRFTAAPGLDYLATPLASATT